MAKEKNRFVVEHSYAALIAMMDDSQIANLVKAVFVNETGVQMQYTLDDKTETVFTVVKADLDAKRKQYEETNQKKQEAGKKGGRPKKETADTPTNNAPHGYS